MFIRRYEGLNYTPALVLATKGWLEQVQDGFGDATASIHWEQNAVTATPPERGNHGDPVGVITWTLQKSLRAIYIEQAYVEPSWRRTGLFTLMLADLRDQARTLGVPGIRLGTSPRNQIAQDVYRRLGGEVFGVFFEFKTDGRT